MTAAFAYGCLPSPLLRYAPQSVVVHQLSRGVSQNPFRKAKGGRVVRVAFHPAKPFFFVASQAHVRRRAWQ